jgi:hypothetical protein
LSVIIYPPVALVLMWKATGFRPSSTGEKDVRTIDPPSTGEGLT